MLGRLTAAVATACAPGDHAADTAPAAHADLAAAALAGHERLGDLLRRLRPLAIELRATGGLTHDTTVIFGGVATLARLHDAQRDLARRLVLDRAAAAVPPRRSGQPPAPTLARAAR